MPMFAFLKHKKYSTTILFLLSASPFALIQQPSLTESDKQAHIVSNQIQEEKKGILPQAFSLFKKDNLTELQKQARLYRSQGLELQRMGNLEGAMSAYQKAIQVDPVYAVAYNDLGIIYEAYEWFPRAEVSYLQAIRLDPNYLSPYSNLALLYEQKGDLEKAAFYWVKRFELGVSGEPWTEKARKKLGDLAHSVPALRDRLLNTLLKQKAKELDEKIQNHLRLAQEFYRKAQYNQAINDLNIVLSLDPQNAGAFSLLKTAKAKLLEQETKEQVAKVKGHLNLAKRLYDKADYHKAMDELNQVLSLEPQHIEALSLLKTTKAKLLEQEAKEFVKVEAKEKAVKEVKASPEIQRHLDLAKRFYRRFQYDKAMDELNLVLSLEPQNEQALSLMDDLTDKLREQEVIELDKDIVELKSRAAQFNK